MIRTALALLSGVLAFVGYVPYARAIRRGRVHPSRATRSMFAILMVVTLLQQKSLGSGAAMVVTFAEGLGSLAILALSVRHGRGGWRRLDKICYGLLALDIFVWQISRDALLALWLSVLADLIAFTPTLHKTWRDPKSEAPLFYMLGALAPVLSIMAATDHDLRTILFPAYLALANCFELLLIYRPVASTAESDSLL